MSVSTRLCKKVAAVPSVAARRAAGTSRRRRGPPRGRRRCASRRAVARATCAPGPPRPARWRAQSAPGRVFNLCEIRNFMLNIF